jgi:RNA polymerase sigma-70 factor, ECF subfamily
VNDGPDPRPFDDAALARRIATAPSGDAEAEAELCRRMAPRVRLYGLRHLRDDHAAADLVQQVLMMTLERLRAGKLREPEMLASFMFGMCRMVVLESRRTYARRERLLTEFADDVPIADSSSAPRLDHERLLHCLDGLSERERSVLVLTFYDDQPALAVARELALSEGNVRVIRHRGLQRLRDCVTGGYTRE